MHSNAYTQSTLQQGKHNHPSNSTPKKVKEIPNTASKIIKGHQQ